MISFEKIWDQVSDNLLLILCYWLLVRLTYFFANVYAKDWSERNNHTTTISQRFLAYAVAFIVITIISFAIFYIRKDTIQTIDKTEEDYAFMITAFIALIVPSFIGIFVAFKNERFNRNN